MQGLTLSTAIGNVHVHVGACMCDLRRPEKSISDSSTYGTTIVSTSTVVGRVLHRALAVLADGNKAYYYVELEFLTNPPDNNVLGGFFKDSITLRPISTTVEMKTASARQVKISCVLASHLSLYSLIHWLRNPERLTCVAEI